VKAKIEP